MATKRKEVFIEKSGNEFIVYSDLKKDELKSIEGVASVIPRPFGGMYVNIDKRYDLDEVLRNIREKAKL